MSFLKNFDEKRFQVNHQSELALRKGLNRGREQHPDNYV